MQVTFIDAEIPEPGTLQEVAPGIFWLRMPLPFDLDHINLYLLKDNQNGRRYPQLCFSRSICSGYILIMVLHGLIF